MLESFSQNYVFVLPPLRKSTYFRRYLLLSHGKGQPCTPENQINVTGKPTNNPRLTDYLSNNLLSLASKPFALETASGYYIRPINVIY